VAVRERTLEIDWGAVWAGAATALLVAVPAALLAQGIDAAVSGDQDWLRLLVLPQLFAFVLGGFGAGRRRPDTPMLHGALAALVAFVLVQAIGVVRLLVADEDVNWVAIAFSFLMSACLGAIGGRVALNRPAPSA
jgi:putative membrane protein (TIGR04086 family)